MMEFTYRFPDTADEASEGKKGSPFVERKFLGERRRKAPKANGDDTFVRISLPNLERQTSLRVLTARNTPLVTMEMCTDGRINAVR